VVYYVYNSGDIKIPEYTGVGERSEPSALFSDLGAVIKNIMQYVIDDAEQLKVEVTKGGEAFIQRVGVSCYDRCPECPGRCGQILRRPISVCRT